MAQIIVIFGRYVYGLKLFYLDVLFCLAILRFYQLEISCGQAY
jgi:hypothetical protein